jgi:hypothetical protein
MEKTGETSPPWKMNPEKNSLIRQSFKLRMVKFTSLIPGNGRKLSM